MYGHNTTRALMGYLADKPTCNFDSKTGVEIVELLHELNREEGVTIIFATHDYKYSLLTLEHIKTQFVVNPVY